MGCGTKCANTGISVDKLVYRLGLDRIKVQQMISQAPDGYIVEIKKPSRSLEQNALYWSTIHEIAENVSVDGRSYTPQVWHRYFKERFLPGKIVELPGGHVIEVASSTTDLTVEDFSNFVEQVFKFYEEHK
jgi:hypothetical protein